LYGGELSCIVLASAVQVAIGKELEDEGLLGLENVGGYTRRSSEQEYISGR